MEEISRASMDPAAAATLDEVKPAPKGARIRPVDAATLIVIDRQGRHPKFLMGKRHGALKFMPDKFVFPGGRIEAGDGGMSVSGILHPRAEQALMARVPRPSQQRGRALALAAIREAYEETGIMFGTREYGPPERIPNPAWEDFRQHGILPDLEALQVIARAVTPPGRARRFDTRFFAIDRKAVGHVVDGVVGPDSELVELAWVTFTQARALDLPLITRMIVKDLEDRIAQGFIPELPVPFYYQSRGRSIRDQI